MRKVGKKRKKNGGEIATSPRLRFRLYRRFRAFARSGAVGSARKDGASARSDRPDFGKAVAVSRENRSPKRVDASTDKRRSTTMKRSNPFGRSAKGRRDRERSGLSGVAQRRLSTGEYQRMKIKGRLSTGEYQRVKIKGKSRIIRRGGFRREALRRRSRPRPSKEPVRRVRATLRVRRRPRRF